MVTIQGRGEVKRTQAANIELGAWVTQTAILLASMRWPS